MSLLLDKKQEIYVNAKQTEFLQATQKRKAFIGGRGSGKSTVQGFQLYLMANALPRAKVFLAGITYTHIHNKVLPSVLEAFRLCGLSEYNLKTKLGHFSVFRKPPEGWLKPYQSPRNYTNCITFQNGFTIELLSSDRADTMRGGNYDGGFIDEAAVMAEDDVNKVILPMIRGNLFNFQKPHQVVLHQLFSIFSSAAWLQTGQWIYKNEELYKQKPERYFFLSSTAYDNIEILGPHYIPDLKDSLTDLEFQVEVMNRRLKKLPNGFYPSFSEKTHCYSDSYHYQFDDKTGSLLTPDKFYDPQRKLEVSFDFNAAFTSLIVCQEFGNEFHVIDCMHVKDSLEETGEVVKNKVTALTELFCEKYINHQRKEVDIHGDRNGNSRSAGQERTFYQQIQEKFKSLKWESRNMVSGLDPEHRIKHMVINAILAEEKPNYPKVRINQNNCKWLIISINGAGMKADFTKDKSSESQDIDQERATHYSDCFDLILYRKYLRLFGGGSQDIGFSFM